MITALILIPVIAGLIALLLPSLGVRRILLPVTAVAHFAIFASTMIIQPSPVLYGWIDLDSTGRLFLGLVSLLFLITSFYTLAYLGREESSKSNETERVFIACLLFFLAAMTLVTVSQHIGLLWVAVEATTLVSAPLIYFHRNAGSLEATWKYLLICSVGIALALLGTFFLAASEPDGGNVPLLLKNLTASAGTLNKQWLKAAFVCLLVGYGTKMGLAPLHTWLPDAHSESPSPVSALFSGVLLNCAFLGILRGLQICNAAGLQDYTGKLLIGFGILSMLVAAIFLVRPVDFKRMLAYSSVEHMGIIAFGMGIGGLGAYGSLLHVVNHSLTKGMLFLVAGNIVAFYETKSIDKVQGMFRKIPVSAFLWITGFLAITGSPPFGTFLSEFTILRAAVNNGEIILAVIYLLLLSVAFIGMARVFISMAQGTPEGSNNVREKVFEYIPPALLGAGVFLLGLWIPSGLNGFIESVVRMLGSVQ